MTSISFIHDTQCIRSLHSNHTLRTLNSSMTLNEYRVWIYMTFNEYRVWIYTIFNPFLHDMTCNSSAHDMKFIHTWHEIRPLMTFIFNSSFQKIQFALSWHSIHQFITLNSTQDSHLFPIKKICKLIYKLIYKLISNLKIYIRKL